MKAHEEIVEVAHDDDSTPARTTMPTIESQCDEGSGRLFSLARPKDREVSSVARLPPNIAKYL